MKTKFFFFAMLGSVAASAQTSITVAPINADYANQTVRFSVSWANGSRNATHNSKVWVFIDYRTVTNNVPSGSWSRALISGTPLATTGTPSRETGNDKGFWLQGNSGAYSATVTVKLSNVPTKFNWCAYVSDYPPNVTLDKGTYTFKGTTNFLVSSHAQPLTSKTIAKASLTVNSSSTFTDATGCPGIGSLYCPYTGSDLYMDVTHLCKQRTSGAGNWEAWIKDTRDNELYRIVKMPDNNWWLAENVRYAGTGSTIPISSCTPAICGRWYNNSQYNGAYGGTSGYGENKQGVCPNGWYLPTMSNWTTFYQNISTNSTTLCQRLRSLNSKCTPIPDYYGWANKMDVGYKTGATIYYGSHWWANNYAGGYYFRIDHQGYVGDVCNVFELNAAVDIRDNATGIAVRCFRTL